MRATKMPLAYSYQRFSSPKQSEGDSITRQTRMSDQWCERNRVQMDTSLTFKDEGLSAHERESLDGYALGEFIEHAKSGRVQKGSYLIVENLDRLSRELPVIAMNRFTGILLEGIKIVQLSPNERVYDTKASMPDLMNAVMEFGRGNSESASKKDRGSSVWLSKRKAAREGNKPMTRNCPSWLKIVSGAFVINEERAEVVRRVFSEALEGLGAYSIAKRLNEGKVPAWHTSAQKKDGKPRQKKPSGMWTESAIRFLLTNPAVYGEFQPHVGKHGNGKDRKPEGEPLPNYFPTVVSRKDFYAVKNGRKRRCKFAGQRTEHVNLFSGLLRDCYDGSTMTVNHRKDARATIIPTTAKHNKDIPFTSFPADVFETALLSELVEVDPSAILPLSQEAQRVEALSGEYSEAAGHVTKLKSKITGNPDLVDTLGDALASWEAKRKTLALELSEAQRDAANPTSEAWGDFKTVGEALKHNNDYDSRLRVQNGLRRIVKCVNCLFLGGKYSGTRKRVALVLVEFHNTDATRAYVIDFIPSEGNNFGVASEEWVHITSHKVEDWGSALDIRKPEDAAKLAIVWPCHE